MAERGQDKCRTVKRNTAGVREQEYSASATELKWNSKITGKSRCAAGTPNSKIVAGNDIVRKVQESRLGSVQEYNKWKNTKKGKMQEQSECAGRVQELFEISIRDKSEIQCRNATK